MILKFHFQKFQKFKIIPHPGSYFTEFSYFELNLKEINRLFMIRMPVRNYVTWQKIQITMNFFELFPINIKKKIEEKQRMMSQKDGSVVKNIGDSSRRSVVQFWALMCGLTAVFISTSKGSNTLPLLCWHWMHVNSQTHSYIEERRKKE